MPIAHALAIAGGQRGVDEVADRLDLGAALGRQARRDSRRRWQPWSLPPRASPYCADLARPRRRCSLLPALGRLRLVEDRLVLGLLARRRRLLRPRPCRRSPRSAAAAERREAAGSTRARLRKAMRLARSWGLPRPAKVILVPGANFFGLASQAVIVVPVPVAADALQRVGISEAGMAATRLAHHAEQAGPSALAPPGSALWQAAHFLNTCSPLAGSAMAR